MTNNIGRIITDFYCNGFFQSREYDYDNSIIIAEGDEYLVIKKSDGKVEFANFQNCLEQKQYYIDKWCKE